MTLKCKCGVTNRIPSLPTCRIRCGTCKYEFTPTDLVKAVREAPPVYELDREDDDFEDLDEEKEED